MAIIEARAAAGRGSKRSSNLWAKGATSEPQGAPMSEINTTPLIDVMLVLLIMIIITVPPVSHTITVDLPNGPMATTTDPIKNVLLLEQGGAAQWNGTRVDDAQLNALLSASAAMFPQPETHFQPDPLVRYERVDKVLAMARRDGVTKLGFVGNQNYAGAF